MKGATGLVAVLGLRSPRRESPEGFAQRKVCEARTIKVCVHVYVLVGHTPWRVTSVCLLRLSYCCVWPRSLWKAPPNVLTSDFACRRSGAW